MAVVPTAKAVYICDEAVRDVGSGKITLVNLWDPIRPGRGSTFPYRLPRMCVFAWLRDGEGPAWFRVDIVDIAADALCHRSRHYRIDIPARNVSVYASFRIQDIPFPRPGSYLVELYRTLDASSGQWDFVDDQIIRVHQPA